MQAEKQRQDKNHWETEQRALATHDSKSSPNKMMIWTNNRDQDKHPHNCILQLKTTSQHSADHQMVTGLNKSNKREGQNSDPLIHTNTSQDNAN